MLAFGAAYLFNHPSFMDIKADIFLLTKNGGALFRRVLDAILSQQTSWPYRVFVVDSGSTDGTVEFVRQRPKVTLQRIPPEEFQHGRTRNMAMTLGTGEFGVFLTQDALPANTQWLENLVDACAQNCSIAGAFGRHLPYPGSNPFMARDLKAHFDRYAAEPPLQFIDNKARYEEDVHYRQKLHFFSDCNACIRRSVWTLYPYPEVDFAEDQLWAERILLAGYYKAYADTAVVYHSHDFDIINTLRRSFDESSAYRRFFNYRLCTSVRQIFGTTWGLTRNDMRYAMQRRLFLRAPWHTLRQPLRNVARLFGYYWGERSSSLPAWFTRCLSLDQSKKRG